MLIMFDQQKVRSTVFYPNQWNRGTFQIHESSLKILSRVKMFLERLQIELPVET